MSTLVKTTKSKKKKVNLNVVFPKRIISNELIANVSVRISKTTFKFVRKNAVEKETFDATLRRMIGLTKENVHVSRKTKSLDS